VVPGTAKKCGEKLLGKNPDTGNKGENGRGPGNLSQSVIPGVLRIKLVFI
jgi:hypothetical protein